MRAGVFHLLDTLGLSVILKRLRVKGNEVAILTFHRVSDEADDLWPPMRVDIFSRLMEYLSHETSVVPLENLHSVSNYPSKPLVCLSFDDGYMDFFENALPILRKYSLPCHHNICPGLIDAGVLPWTQVLNIYLQQHRGGILHLPDGREQVISHNFSERDYLDVLDIIYKLDDSERRVYIQRLTNKLSGVIKNRLMGWKELRICSEAGVHIGSHSLYHNNLAMNDDDALLRKDISESRSRIMEEIGQIPDFFAFPSGQYNKRCLNLVQTSGFKVALLCEDKIVPFQDCNQAGFSVMTRINIGNRSLHEEKLRALGFHQKINGLVSRVSYVQKSQ